jgi:hypothetical protein
VPDHPQLPAAYTAAAAGQWLAGRPHESRALARHGIHTAGGPTALAAAVPPELAIVCVSLAASAALALYQLPSLPEEHPAQAGQDDRAKTLPVYRQLTDLTMAGTLGQAFGLAVQAVARADEGDPAACAIVRDAVGQARASANPTAIALTRYAEARILADADPATALAALDDARTVAAAAGCRLVSAFTLAATVTMRGRHGPPGQALPLFHEAIALWRSTGNHILLARLLAHLVLLLTRTGHYADAVDLAAGLQHATNADIRSEDRQRLATALAEAHRRLGDHRYQANWSTGARRSLDDTAERAQHLVADQHLRR